MAWIIRGADQSGPNITSPNYLSVTADFTDATWNTVAGAGTHEVFTVTGLVRMRMWIECTGDVDSAAHGATISFGNETAVAGYIAATDEALIDTGELWYSIAPAAYDTFGNVVMDYVVNGLDVGYQILVEALTTGSLVFHCVWEALNATGAVVAGAGGAL